jgi:hypothetical protein
MKWVMLTVLCRPTTPTSEGMSNGAKMNLRQSKWNDSKFNR